MVTREGLRGRVCHQKGGFWCGCSYTWMTYFIRRFGDKDILALEARLQQSIAAGAQTKTTSKHARRHVENKQGSCESPVRFPPNGLYMHILTGARARVRARVCARVCLTWGGGVLPARATPPSSPRRAPRQYAHAFACSSPRHRCDGAQEEAARGRQESAAGPYYNSADPCL